jgi:hypothetical protein
VMLTIYDLWIVELFVLSTKNLPPRESSVSIPSLYRP